MGADILERLDFMMISRRSDEDAIIRDARAEIVRLRGEVAALLEDPDEAELAYRCGDPDSDAIAPAEAKDPAPAMPNGVEGPNPPTPRDLAYAEAVKHGLIQEREGTSRAADNRDAAVVVPAWIATWMADREILPDDDGDGISEGALVEALNNHERELLNAIPKAPAAVPAGEAVAYSVVQVGNRGAAYDPPNTHRAFTYEHQPGNIDASRLGRATNAAAVASAGDSIDRGLSLLKELQALGFGVFQIGPPAPVQAAPQEGEQDTSRWPLLDRVEFALRDAGFDYDEAFRIAHMAAHPSACELGAVLKEIRAAADSGGANEGQCYNWWRKFEAALQHRGDSQEAGRG